MCYRPLSPWCECLLPAQNDCSKTGMPDCPGETTPGERSGSTSWSNTAAKLGHAEGPTDHTRGSSSVGETFPGGPADLWDFPWTLSSATIWCWLQRPPQSSIADARACRGEAAGAPSCREVPMTSSTVSIIVAQFKFSLVHMVHLTKCHRFVTLVPAVD